MPRFEHRVLRVMVLWDGSGFYLGAARDKSEDWAHIDQLGEQGWELVAFVPHPEAYLGHTFTPEQLRVVQLGVFKRQIKDD